MGIGSGSRPERRLGGLCVVDILVLGEIGDDGLDPVTGELIAAARTLGGTVATALLGQDLDDYAQEAAAYGPDAVLLADSPAIDGSSIDAYVAAFEQVCRHTEPRTVLVGKTPLGQNVGPRVAFRLGAALAQDCIAVGRDEESGAVVAERPVYGGNAVAKVAFTEGGPGFVVLRGRAYDPPVPDRSLTADTNRVDVAVEPSAIRVRRVESVSQDVEGVRLEDASVVVAGGRGLGGPEPFERLRELADLLGGAVGASRAACDAGWVDHSLQVGLTGKSVTPDLYITVGISGASQHMAGCSGSRNIVVVNRDADANIFREASYGVAGDWQKVLPAFIETVRELVS